MSGALCECGVRSVRLRRAGGSSRPELTFAPRGRVGRSRLRAPAGAGAQYVRQTAQDVPCAHVNDALCLNGCFVSRAWDISPASASLLATAASLGAEGWCRGGAAPGSRGPDVRACSRSRAVATGGTSFAEASARLAVALDGLGRGDEGVSRGAEHEASHRSNDRADRGSRGRAGESVFGRSRRACAQIVRPSHVTPRANRRSETPTPVIRARQSFVNVSPSCTSVIRPCPRHARTGGR